MFVAGVVTKRKGFSSVLILSKNKTNQHRTPHPDPQQLDEHSEIHTYRVNLFQMEGGEK